MAVIAVLAGTSPAFADSSGGGSPTTLTSPPTPALVPANPGPGGYFDYTLTQGQSVDGSVAVRNPGTALATFALYPTDAATSAATGVAYGGLGATLHATGSWIHLAASRIVLGPGQAQIVPFRLTVPLGATPGDYVGAIAAENPTAGQQNARAGHGVGVTLNVNTRVVVATVIHVPGPAAVAIQLGKPGLVAQNGNQQVVTFPMDDTGGLLAKPALAATLRRCAGGPGLADLTRQLDTFVPHTTIVYSWPLGQLVLAAGCYRVTATVTDKGSTLSTVTANITVSAAEAKVKPTPTFPNRHPHSGGLPVWIGIVAAGLAVLLALVALLTLRSRRRLRELEDELARLKNAAQARQP